MGISRVLAVALGGAVAASVMTATPAGAHWCNEIWDSGYNLVVRTASDTVTIPASGPATLDIWIQNNTGYPLSKFTPTATGSGLTITMERQTTAMAGFLMPGENAKYKATISKTGGGQVAASSLNFSVSFGNTGQSAYYGTGTRKAVVIKTPDGTLTPSPPPPGIATYSVQTSLQQSHSFGGQAAADFGSGMQPLMDTYCAGRGSWNANGPANMTSACQGTSTTCPTNDTAGKSATSGDKFAYDRLWAAVGLAVRKSALSTDQLAALRERLWCGAGDPHPAFAGIALFSLAYLGEDATVRANLKKKAEAAGDLGKIAKAALLVMGNAEDVAAYTNDVKSCIPANPPTLTANNSNSIIVAASCAAAIAMATHDDSIVTKSLMPLIGWVEPDEASGSGGYPGPMYAAHLLDLVVWRQKTWAAKGADTGLVAFYGEVAMPGATPAATPAAPGNVSCTTGADGKTIHVAWDIVNTDTSGGNLAVTGYKVYYGTRARPSSSTNPGQGFDYDHADSVSATSADLTNVGGTEYISVTALSQGGASAYSKEVSCVSSNPQPEGGTGGSTGSPGAGGATNGSGGGGPAAGAGGSSAGTGGALTTNAGAGGGNPQGQSGGSAGDSTAPSPAGGSGGCSCSVPDTRALRGMGSFVVAAMLGLAARTRRRRSRL